MAVFLGFVLFPVLLVMSIKLTKFVWQEEKIIPLMLFALTISTLSLALYYIWLVCIY